MGYDMKLIGEDGEIAQVDRHSEGGVHPIGGTTNAEISITYNYSKFFYDVIDKERGIRCIYDRPAGECIKKLVDAIHVLGVYKDEDYWSATPGNAGHILGILAVWAKQHPCAQFEGD